MGELLSQNDFATRRGVGKSAVSNWKKAGLLVFAEDADGRLKVDVERTEARLNARIDPTRGRPTGAVGQPVSAAPVVDAEAPLGNQRTAAHVRIDLAEEQLIAVRQKNAQAAGELAPRAELNRRGAELGRAFRERMHAMFRSISERLAAEREVRAIMAIGMAEIDRVCADLADEFEHGAIADDVDETAEDAAIESEVEAQLAEA